MNFFACALVQGKFVHFQLLLVAAFQHFLVRSAVGFVIDYNQSAVLFKSAVDIALNDYCLISRVFGDIGVYVTGTNADCNLLFTHNKRRMFNSCGDFIPEESFELVALKYFRLVLCQVMLRDHAFNLCIYVEALGRIIEKFHEFVCCRSSVCRIHAAFAQELRLLGSKVFCREFRCFKV